MFRRTRPLLVLLAGAAAPTAATAQAIVSLTVEEPASVRRRAEPVTTGVPFARGAVADVAELTVTNADGEPIPCQLRAISFWPDRSVRWALVDCQVDVPPRGRTVVRVARGERAEAPEPVRVTETEAAIAVSTGPLSFSIGTQRLTLLESLRVGDLHVARGAQLVLHTADGPVVADGPPDEVRVEEAGPLRTVVLARGTYPGVHDGLLRYTVRVTAWAGKPYVGLRVWLENAGSYGYATPPEWCAFDGQSIELDLGLDGVSEVLVDGARLWTGEAPPPRIEVAQHNPAGHWEGFERTLTAGDERVVERGRTGGLVGLQSPAGSLAVAVRYFWENFPKAIELDGNRLRVWLWPTDGAWPPVDGRWSERGAGDFQQYRVAGVYHLPGGVRKGHELLLDASGRHPAGTQATLRKPLMALASPEYYADTEAAPGWFAPGDFRTGDRLYDAAVDIWNRQAHDCVDRSSPTSVWNARTGRAGEVRNWYGWMNFGDNGWGGGFSSLHYDWPWVMLLSYVRLQDRGFFDLGVTMTRHLIEVDHQWSERNHAHFRGMARYEYANPFIHGGVADGRASPNPTHNWVSGIVLYYMLTGDPIAYECAMSTDRGLTLRSVERYAEEPTAAQQARETGWAILCFCSLYDLTGEQAYLDKALVLFRNHQAVKWKEKGPYTDGSLQYYYSVQGLCELHHRTGDPEVMRMLEEGCAGRFGDKYAEWQIFLSNLYAYVGHVQDKPDYITHAKRLFAAWRPKTAPAAYDGTGAWDKGTAKYLRNGHLLQHVLWRSVKRR